MAKFDIVFEGGGAKGIAFAGALDVLFDRAGHEPRRLIGTSAGAITATLVAAGFTPTEVLGFVTEKKGGKPVFKTFMDVPKQSDFTPEEREKSVSISFFKNIDLPFVPTWMERKLDATILDQLLKASPYRQIFSFIERGGIYKGDAPVKWLQGKLATKGVGPNDTMADFHKRTGRDLSVVASDTTDTEMLVLNHRTSPRVPVAWAVRMSMSLPFVWQEVIWQKEWGTYEGRKKTGNAIVDGGMLSNFPIVLLTQAATAEAKKMNEEIMGQARMTGAQVLGILIDETRAVAGEPDTIPKKGKLGGTRTVQRISRLVDTMSGHHDKAMIERHAKKICRVPAKGYGTLEFGLEGSRLRNFLEGGRSAMTEHLQSRNLI